MIFALFMVYIKRPGLLDLLRGLPKERTYFFGYDDRYPVVLLCGLYLFYGLFDLERPDHVDILDPASPYYIFNRDLGPFDSQWFGVHAGMDLITCHGGRAII